MMKRPGNVEGGRGASVMMRISAATLLLRDCSDDQERGRFMSVNSIASSYVIDGLYVIGVWSYMVFIETPIFTADVCTLLSDEEYSALQHHLVTMPNAGDVIASTGGLRKIRWTVAGRGKRGGTRVIYYHVVAQAQIRMILIYRKGIKDDLTPKEKLVLRKINAEW